ncbi:MAG: ABC transporter permease [Planctomycetia bacterium]|nr:ABC transporter permease [Planctomycetia bacterium]
MKAVWSLCRKELRLLIRDRLAAALLLALPLVFVAVLGLILGESFGQKPDDTLRLSIVDLDGGIGMGGKSWAYWVRQDLLETPGIRLEIVPDRATAERLIRDHRRAAILVLNEDFSRQVNACSFLDTPGSINPFHREGVHLDPKKVNLGLEMLRDPTQRSANAIIEQVVQVCMLRIVLPYMIGQAFQKLSEPRFIDRLGDEVRLPVPASMRLLFGERIKLGEMIRLAAGKDAKQAEKFRESVGDGVQAALRRQFNKYDLTGMTWAALTKAKGDGEQAVMSDFVDREGSGLLRRGAALYQTLVPMYTVLFAFFLVLIVGWVFVGERRQGTLKRYRLAPVTHAQILFGKLLPCYAVSVGQGVLLLILGKLVFGMRWGPESWSMPEQIGWLALVVLTTSFAAMGLAMLVASMARTETQVQLFGGVPVLVLGVLGGCVLPREMMPEQAQSVTLFTPHGWALNAYRELLAATPGYDPNLTIVLQSCGILLCFGVGFLTITWWFLRLD